MTKTMTAMVLAAGFSMALAGCSGDAATADNSEATESADTEVATDAPSEADAPPSAYMVDETGQFVREVGEQAMTNINERLASKDAENGTDIRILIVDTSDGADLYQAAEAARADAGADAMIYVNIGEEEIAVVGNNITRQEGEGAANAIVMAFDNENFENGLLNGITATEMHMAE